MSAYYNEHDKFAAEWLRKLIAKNLIAPGEVDERDIQNVQPEELRGFTQCHFFAGIGVWSYALRAAGWPDDSPVWTGSCPCQGFSASGKRGGFSDQRHLWPSWFRLIEECRPDTIFGEQVASKDGLAWLDVVSADMEGAGYAIGTADLCAAGFGAPHIRQRLYFVADSGREQHRGWRGLRDAARAESDSREKVRLRSSDDATDGGAAGELAYTASNRRAGRWESGETEEGRQPRSERCGELPQGSEGRCSVGSLDDSQREQEHTAAAGGLHSMFGSPSILGNTGGERLSERERVGRIQPGTLEPQTREALECGSFTGGFWEAAEWLWCRDNKYRPVEPGTFPLATGATNRVGRLRGYGNALNAEVAKGFIEAYMQVTDFPTMPVTSEVTNGVSGAALGEQV